jgi:hypothetical protein
MPRSSEWSLPLRFSNQITVWISQLSHACYIPRPSHPPWFDHPNNIWWSSSLCSLLQPPAISSLLGPNIFLSTLFSHPQPICVRPSWNKWNSTDIRSNSCAQRNITTRRSPTAMACLCSKQDKGMSNVIQVLNEIWGSFKRCICEA